MINVRLFFWAIAAGWSEITIVNYQLQGVTWYVIGLAAENRL